MAPATAILLLLSLATPLLALSSTSPQDLSAYGKYRVVLGTTGVLNDTIHALLDSTPPPSHSQATRHLIRNPAGQAFLCSVPAAQDSVPREKKQEVDPAVAKLERERGLERGLDLLEPLRKGCLFHRQGWFTYSFCYGSEIRQFHATGNPPAEDPTADSYTLGQSPAPSGASSPKYGSGSALVAKDGVPMRIPATLGGGNTLGLGLGREEGKKYLAQKWEGGTLCDKSGVPRSVEVQFHCSTQSTDRIALIRETAICTYVMLIHTPRICSIPIFNEGSKESSEPASVIQCEPVVRKLRPLVDPPVETPAPVDDIETTTIDAIEPAVDVAATATPEYPLSNPDSPPPAPPLPPSPTSDLPDSTPDLSDPPSPSSDDEIDEEDQLITVFYDPETGALELSPSPSDDSLSVSDLEDLARVMRRSISKALDKLDPSSSEETDSKFESILSDSATTQSEIQALFNAISNGISQQREVKKGMERVGSEQLEELRRGFGRVYDEEEEEEEGVGRARDEL